MLFHIPDVLKPDQVASLRKSLDEAKWVNGQESAGAQAAKVKDNLEIPADHPKSKEAGGVIRASLARNQMFAMVALPLSISDPMFNRYQAGQTYGGHIDNALRPIAGAGGLMRGDLSATLFLSGPDEYDGGELLIEDTFGIHNTKLPAGHMVVYPASSLHQVKPVTRGARVASFFWIQSIVRDHGKRSLLLELDLAIQGLVKNHPEEQANNRLLGVYHNLLRRWSEV